MVSRLARSRRDFIRHGVVLAGSAALGAGCAVAPDAEKPGGRTKGKGLIDAHVHVWTDEFAEYPLAAGFKPEDVKPKTFLPEDILRHAAGSGVDRIVLIQMSFYRFDNSYMLDVIRRRPETFRGVAIVDSASADPDAQMRTLTGKGVRGFRVSPGKAPPETWLDGEGFEKMFRCGASNRLAICPLINPRDLPALSRRCGQFPDTPVVIDHMARIGVTGRMEEAEVAALCGMAKHKQVKVKVSAFYALGEKKPPHTDLIPLIRRLCDAFGPARLMWASDCPFQVDNETYEDGVSLVRDRLDFLSADDKDRLLRRTAEEVFFS